MEENFSLIEHLVVEEAETAIAAVITIRHKYQLLHHIPAAMLYIIVR